MTNKNEYQTLNTENIKWACDIISKAVKLHKVVIVHGAGSFGHFEAKEYKINEDIKSNQIDLGVSLCRNAVQKLNRHFVDELLKHDVPCTSISPIGWFRDELPIPEFFEMINSLTNQNIVPVIHGDVIFDQTMVFSILSGDKIIKILAKQLKPKIAIFVTDVHGIYPTAPSKDDDALGKGLIRNLVIRDNQIDVKCDKIEHDVTGGILTKIQR